MPTCPPRLPPTHLTSPAAYPHHRQNCHFGSLIHSAVDTDLGFVPLFNLTGVHDFSRHWSAILDLEGAAAPQGRAIDAALKLSYHLNDRTRIAAGYRTIEGGADNDTVYTFAWTHAAVVSVAWSF